jgi:excinuclease ABC subunit B
MERAMAETDRRRAKQVSYNTEHGITPRTIEKKVTDIMEGAHDDHKARGRRTARVAEAEARYADVTPANLGRAIAELEKKMFTHAELLEFEEAAQVRDEITQLKDRVLLSSQ